MRSLNLFLTAVITLSSVSLIARAEESQAPQVTPQVNNEIEIGIRSILIAEKAWDDQHSVTAMVQGELPSVCHAIGRTEFAPIQWGDIHAFSVHQFVIRRVDGDCAPDSGIMHTQQTVPFSKPVQLGVLPANDYLVGYFSNLDDETSGNVREFSVSVSATDPNLPKLAQVRSIEMATGLQPGQPVSVTLQGTLANPCVQISRLTVIQEKDTFTVSLTASADPELICTQQITAFSETLELTPTAEPGEFLVHARVIGTAPVQKVFSIAHP